MNQIKWSKVLRILLGSAATFTVGCTDGLPAKPGGVGLAPIPLPRPLGIVTAAAQVAGRTVSLRPGAGAPASRVGAPPLVDTTSRPGTTLLRDPGTGEIVGSVPSRGSNVGAPPLVDTTSRPGTTLLRDPGTGEIVGSVPLVARPGINPSNPGTQPPGETVGSAPLVDTTSLPGTTLLRDPGTGEIVGTRSSSPVGSGPLIDRTSQPGNTLLRDPGTGEIVTASGGAATAPVDSRELLSGEPVDLGVQAP